MEALQVLEVAVSDEFRTAEWKEDAMIACASSLARAWLQIPRVSGFGLVQSLIDNTRPYQRPKFRHLLLP